MTRRLMFRVVPTSEAFIYKRVLFFEDDTNRKATVCKKIDANFAFCSFVSTGEGPEKVSCGSYCGCRNSWRQRRAELALH